MITLIKSSFVIGFGERDHVVWTDAEIAYEGQKVIFVGRGFPGQPDRVVDAGHAIVSPGFIDLDALADIDHALIDTWHGPETAPGLLWSQDYFLNRRRDVFTPEDRAFMRRYAFTQLIRNGITTAMPIAAETHSQWAETYAEMAAAADAAAELGLRIYLGPSFRSGINVTRDDGTRDVLWNEPLGAAGFTEAMRFARDYASRHGDLVRACLLPCRIETLSLDIMKQTAAAMEELGCLVRMHCLQSTHEQTFLDRWYGRQALDLLDETGLLGPRLLMPHGIYIGGHSSGARPYAGERERIADAGATVIHCPMTMLRNAAVMETFDRFRQAGVNIALGTDSFPPDMIRNMDIGGNLMKWAEGRLDAGSAADYFRAATIGGATALGRDDLGRLRPGAMADLIVVDLSGARVGPVDDPVRTLLMNCTGADIRHVVINGRTVMEDRRLPGVDDERDRRRAQAFFDTMKEAYCERDYRRRPVRTLFPASFPHM